MTGVHRAEKGTFWFSEYRCCFRLTLAGENQNVPFFPLAGENQNVPFFLFPIRPVLHLLHGQP